MQSADYGLQAGQILSKPSASSYFIVYTQLLT